MKEPPLWLYFIVIVTALIIIWLAVREDPSWCYRGCRGQDGTVMIILLVLALFCTAIATCFVATTRPYQGWLYFASFTLILVLLVVWAICLFVWGSQCRVKKIRVSPYCQDYHWGRGFCPRAICAGVGFGFLTLMAVGIHLVWISEEPIRKNLWGVTPLMLWLLTALTVNIIWVKDYCWNST